MTVLSIEQIEAACDAGEVLNFSRHDIEAPELSLRGMYFPMGFPVEICTNSSEVLAQFTQLWGQFRKRQNTEPLRAEVLCIESDRVDCPPAPTYRIMQPFITCVADTDNYCLVDLERSTTSVTISSAALRYPLYAQYFLLSMAASCIATRYATPVHAACVELTGSGVLLCGDSGAGKSSLSYACARAGWRYVTDDSTFLLNDGHHRFVTGNCHQIRFRPSARELFGELKGLEITPRAAGKPSIELPTASMSHIKTADIVQADFMVFLKRRTTGRAELKEYRRDAARQFMRQVLYGSLESLTKHYAAIERMLDAKIFALHYSDPESAVSRLEKLVREGQ